MKILLADDSLLVRECIGSALREWGYTVEVAGSGDEALTRIREDADIQIAILDWQMPGLDGPEVCAKLREGEQSRYVYTIVLTAAADGQSIVEAMEQGADDYLLKAAPREELRARLKAASRIVELQLRLRQDAKRLAQAQRMESVGNLSAGMAHELNTPVQYISHNLEFITQELKKFLDCIAAHRIEIPGLDVPFLRSELMPACNETREGIERVKSILNALRDFSATSAQERAVVSVNELVSTASVLCRNEWHDVAELVLDLSPENPRCRCIPQDISQITLQLILNAAQAIQQKVGLSRERGRIGVATEVVSGKLRLSVSDSGCGIPDGIREKIFDPFFTTRTVGTGIGAGLSLIYSAAVERHRGTIDFESRIDVGTTFHITLPLYAE